MQHRRVGTLGDNRKVQNTVVVQRIMAQPNRAPFVTRFLIVACELTDNDQ
jgi:hypothetical protein